MGDMADFILAGGMEDWGEERFDGDDSPDHYVSSRRLSPQSKF